MEILYKRKMYELKDLFTLQGQSGKDYCTDIDCCFCAESTKEHDAHNYQCSFPLKDFKDDLGNHWIYDGIVHRHESSSFGWHHEVHQWTLEKDERNLGAWFLNKKK